MCPPPPRPSDSAGPGGPASPEGGGLSPERRALLARLLKEKGAKPKGEDRIPRRDPKAPVPLSFAQEAVWFLDQLEPERALHNVPGAVRLTGQLDHGALERSLEEIVRRHESLRTHFEERDGKPYQIISAPGPFELPLVDVSDRPKEEADAEASRLATEEAHRVFPLDRGPLFHAFLVRVAPDEHVMVTNFHHTVTDGVSMGVFTREMAALYAAFKQGKPSPLPELPIQFGDFALWQRATLRGDVLEKHLDYWRERLAGDLASIEIPPDRPRPPVQSFKGLHQEVRLSKRLSDDLRRLAKEQGVTHFMVLDAAFRVLLFDYCREVDMVIGSAIAHRNRTELENVIGFLVNMLVVRTDLSGNPPFAQLLQRVRDAVIGAWSHQDLPLTQILREIQPERDLGKNPLFQVQFSLLTPDQNPAVYGYGLAMDDIERIELPGLVMTPVHVQYDNARYDVAAFLWDMPQGVHGTIEYNSDLFDPPTIERMARRYEEVLRAVVLNPRATLDELLARLARTDRAQDSAAEKSFEASAKDRLKSLRRRRSS